MVGVGGLRKVRARKSGGLITAYYVNAIPRKNLQRVRGISVDVSCLSSDTRALSIGGPAVRTRRVPSERLRLVSKSHLTLTWGGVMKQHDLRFAAPCSCLIETSVAHPPILEREPIFACSCQGVRRPHRSARTRAHTRVHPS